MKSALATEIFRQELISLYGEKLKSGMILLKKRALHLKTVTQMQGDTLETKN